jgi:hypothetical protein
MRNYYFLWATIRPDYVKNTYKEWVDKCKDISKIVTKIAVITEQQKEKIDSFNFPDCEVIVYDEKKGYNAAITHLTKTIECNDDDILLLLSDDFFPCNNWDVYLDKKFENWDGALFLNDGYQETVKEGCLCITLACMTFKCLKKLNRMVFHPDYRHYFSDNEAFVNLKELGLLKDDRDIDKEIFEHRHYILGKRKQDDNDILNYSFWDQDKATSQRRLILPIEERLK